MVNVCDYVIVFSTSHSRDATLIATNVTAVHSFYRHASAIKMRIYHEEARSPLYCVSSDISAMRLISASHRFNGSAISAITAVSFVHSHGRCRCSASSKHHEVKRSPFQCKIPALVRSSNSETK